MARSKTAAFTATTEWQDVPDDAEAPDFDDITEDYDPDADLPYLVRKPSEWDWRAAEQTLIEGLAAPGSLVWMYAPSGHGKTLIALGLSWHLARGDRWYGRTVTRGLVVYVAAEGAASVELRLHALARHHGVDLTDDLPLRTIRRTVDISEPDALIRTVAALERQTGLACVLIVLDTVSQLLAEAGLAENDTGMGAVLKFCNDLRQGTGAAALALHHTPQSDPKRSRGHGAAANAADARWLVAKARNDVVTLKVDHAKDGPAGIELRFSVGAELVGQGANGPVSGALALPTSEPPAPDCKLDNRQDLLVKALARHGAKAHSWTFDWELFKHITRECGAWDPDATSTRLAVAASNLRRSLLTRRVLLDFNADTKAVTLAVAWRNYDSAPPMADLAEQLAEVECFSEILGPETARNSTTKPRQGRAPGAKTPP